MQKANSDPQEFQLTRVDKMFKLQIDTYTISNDTVFYLFALKDLTNNKQYQHEFRFKQLQAYYEQLRQLKYDLPKFPKKQIFRKTNKNPQLIRERMKALQIFYEIVLNDPYTRGHPSLKKFVSTCKFGNEYKQRPSSVRFTQSTISSQRRCSQGTKAKNLIPINVILPKKLQQK